MRSFTLDGIGLSLLASALSTFAVLSTITSHQNALQPAQNGVMAFHLYKTGELRLWNQPVRPHDVAKLLQRAQARSSTEMVMVRLIPHPDVPWGVIRGGLKILQPNPQQHNLHLQLQLP